MPISVTYFSNFQIFKFRFSNSQIFKFKDLEVRNLEIWEFRGEKFGNLEI